MTNAVNIAQGGSNNVTMRNRIINGSMQVAQRGNVVLSANGATYGGPDRFILTVGGFSTVSVIALQAGAVFTGSPKSYQIGNLLTTGGPGTVSIVQRIESANTYDLNSQPVTITLQVLQQTGATLNAQLVLRKPTAVDNFTSVTLIAASALLPVADSTNTTLTFTTTLGAADATNGLQVDLLFPTVPATSSKQIYTAMWQLEAGTTASPFEQRLYGTELALCQRYYYQASPLRGIGVGGNLAVVRVKAPLPVTMRVAPELAKIGSPSLYNALAVATLSSVGANYSSADCIEFDGVASASLAAGTCVSFYNNFDGATVAAYAEL
jgi:hypothetical protein